MDKLEQLSPRVQSLVSRGEPIVGAAALATIPLLLAEDRLTPGWALLANTVIWTVFTGHFLFILFACRGKLERRLWWRRSLLDILIILASLPFLPSTLQSLRLLRTGHAVRLLHLVRGGRILTLGWLLRWAKRRFRLSPIVFSGSTAIVAMVIGANALYLLEPEVAPDLETALWYAFATCSTVGYGDVTPTSLGGRVVGILLMIVGVASMASFSGALASYLMASQDADDRTATAAILTELREMRAQLDRLEARTSASSAPPDGP